MPVLWRLAQPSFWLLEGAHSIIDRLTLAMFSIFRLTRFVVLPAQKMMSNFPIKAKLLGLGNGDLSHFAMVAQLRNCTWFRSSTRMKNTLKCAP